MKIWMTAMSLVMVAALAACQKSDDGGGGSPAAPAAPTATTNPTQYATTPQPCNAPQVTANCYDQFGHNPGAQGQYPSNWQWPNQWQPSQGYCGCPYGYSPVLTQGSMACVPNYYFVQPQVVYFSWGVSFGSAQNSQWNNIPQNQYSQAQAHSQTEQCYNQTAQGCDVRINNCGSGSVCQPVSGGSTIGLCVRGAY